MSSSSTSLESNNVSKKTPLQNFHQPTHRTIASFLQELSQCENSPTFSLRFMLGNIPTKALLMQCFWTSVITAGGYYLSRSIHSPLYDTLSVDFWSSSRLNVPSSLSFGLGWALFVLLSFYLREASHRYRQSRFILNKLSYSLKRIIRLLKCNYPPESWHANDHDRILSHLISLPLLLTNNPKYIRRILNEKDAHFLLSNKNSHLKCTQVIRSYFTVMEDDTHQFYSNTSPNTKQTPIGAVQRANISFFVDEIDKYAIELLSVKHIQPAYAYVNHLSIFLCVWLMFVPLSLLSTSGWFTIIWSLLTTYSVVMVFKISNQLNKPFGNDDQELVPFCAKISYDLLHHLSTEEYQYANLLGNQSSASSFSTIPLWLRKKYISLKSPSAPRSLFSSSRNSLNVLSSIFSTIKNKISHKKRQPVYFSLILFTLWALFVICLTYFLSRGQPRNNGVRWWNIYLPISSSSTGYVGTVLSTLFAFWLDDSYGRYRKSLELWRVSIKSNIETFAYQLSTITSPSTIHKHDHERLISHLILIPYLLKHELNPDAFPNLKTDVESFIDNSHDAQVILQAKDPLFYCISVIVNYISSFDKKFLYMDNAFAYPYGAALNLVQVFFTDLEYAIVDLKSLKQFPVPKLIQYHLTIVTFIWLLSLPLNFVIHDGFLSFIYVIPSAYCILYLLQVGFQLDIPFGTDNDDIPMAEICEQIRVSLNHTYQETSQGTKYYITNFEGYETKDNFTPKTKLLYNENLYYDDDNEYIHENQRLTFTSLYWKIKDNLPQVSLISLLIALCWCVVAVCLSFGLSRVWNDDRQMNCRKWCSPIDVDPAILANLGFTLFLILAFRVFDSVNRYNEGAKILSEIRLQVRSFAIDIIMSFKEGTFHTGDKQRIIAHLVEIPYALGNQLLNTKKKKNAKLLNIKDNETYIQSDDSLLYLLRVIETYYLTTRMPGREHIAKPDESLVSSGVTFHLFTRMREIRRKVEQIITMKKYPFNTSYRRHQQVFLGFWLGLLPLSMTSQTGFLTVLWSSIIMYGILAFEEIAVRLVNPFGYRNNASSCIPVMKICHGTVMDIIESLKLFEWDIHNSVSSHKQIRDKVPNSIGIVFDENNNNEINEMVRFASLDNHQSGNSLKNITYEFGYLNSKRKKPTILSHFIYYTPWFCLQSITLWTTIACVLSFIFRDRTEDGKARWWTSNISIAPSASTYLSFLSFTLLGFYVTSSYNRYESAYHVWASSLRIVCHALVSQFRNYFPPNGLHENDHPRLIGFIASLPLVLKQELRGSRDLREIVGLLGSQDISKISTSKSMSMYVISIIRAYFIKVAMRSDTYENSSWNHVMAPLYNLTIRLDILRLENVVQDSLYYKEFDLPASFTTLLDTWLTIWFLILPFILTEISGWLTIFWMPLIGFAVLGMKNIATKVKNPYCDEINDIDLDKLAHEIVTDIILTYRLNQPNSPISMNPPHQLTSTERRDNDNANFIDTGTLFKNAGRKKQISSYKLALRPMSIRLSLAILIWSISVITCLYFINLYLPSSIGNQPCDPWFCSAVSLGANAKEFLGFALFLILGFRLSNSHGRYMLAKTIWKQNIYSQMHIFSSRIFSVMKRGNFHKNDVDRIFGFLLSFILCQVNYLRGDNQFKSRELLKQVINQEDTKLINDTFSSSLVGSDLCIDSIRTYLLQAERNRRMQGKEATPFSMWELIRLFLNIGPLSQINEINYGIKRVKVPFSYILQLRIFLFIWVLILPFGLVERTGWLAILWTCVMAYGVVGVEHWAHELADPFGHDISDIPLESLVNEVVEVVKENFQTFDIHGLESFIKKDRGGFLESTDIFLAINDEVV